LGLSNLFRDRIDESASYLLRQAALKGACGSDVLFSSRTGHMLSLREGEPEENISGSSMGIGLRTIDKEGRQGIAYVNSLEKDDLHTLVEWSWNNCRLSEPDPDVCLCEASRVQTGLQTSDPEMREIDPQFRLDACTAMTDLAVSADPRVESVRSASWADGEGNILYVSSSGFSGWYHASTASCGLALVMKGEESREMGGFGEESRLLASLDPVSISEEAVRRTSVILDGKPMQTGRYDLILDPEATASLLEIIGELFLASNVSKNKSLLRDHLGKRITSSPLTIIDDGALPWGVASSPFDGEGCPTGKTVVMDNGTVTSFLCNLKYAKIMGIPSTGNASRGISTLPDVDISNFYIQPGDVSREGVFSRVEKGLYIMEFLGLHTVDPVSGDFSVGIKGYYVEDGHHISAVSGMTVAGNLVDLLDRIDIIGNDLRFFGNIGGCTLVVRDVAAAGH
jgi:PmbA protein